jgi:hypothetical protein
MDGRAAFAVGLLTCYICCRTSTMAPLPAACSAPGSPQHRDSSAAARTCHRPSMARMKDDCTRRKTKVRGPASPMCTDSTMRKLPEKMRNSHRHDCRSQDPRVNMFHQALATDTAVTCAATAATYAVMNFQSHDNQARRQLTQHFTRVHNTSRFPMVPDAATLFSRARTTCGPRRSQIRWSGWRFQRHGLVASQAVSANLTPDEPLRPHDSLLTIATFLLTNLVRFPKAWHCHAPA